MGRGKPPAVTEDEKWCSKCKSPRKIVTEFGVNASRKDGLQNWCKSCLGEYQRSIYDYEKMRDRQLRQNYPGFDLAQYNALFEAQGGVCAACGQAETIRVGRSSRSEDIVPNLAVDHCHKTNKVRALLCHPCNQAYGLLEEDPQRIKALLKYAEEHLS